MASVILGAEEGFAGSIGAASEMVLGQTQGVRVEKPFDPEEKDELDAVAPVISVRALADLLKPLTDRPELA